MKAIRCVLFALTTLFFAACAERPCHIIESSTNGLSGVRMPLRVDFTEEVKLREGDLSAAVAIRPYAPVEVAAAGARTLRITPKSPLEYDTRYEVTLDAAKLTDGRLRGTARFEFATPKLRFTYDDPWLRHEEDLSSFQLVGQVTASDWVDSLFVERNLRVKGLLKPDVRWTHSDDGTQHRYVVRQIVPRAEESYAVTLAFDYGEKKSLTVEVPRKGEYAVIDHTVQREPLAVVVTFSEPIRPNQNLKDLVRFPAKFRTSVDKNRLYIYPETRLSGSVEVEIGRDVLSRGNRPLAESCRFTAELPSEAPAVRFAGKGSILPAPNRNALLFEAVNYERVRVRVRRIFASNLLQFFQRNDYADGNYSDLDYVSRVVRDTTIDLAADAQSRLDRLHTYSLDLARLIADRKSMYLLEIRGVDPLIPTDEYDYDYYFGDYRTYRERSKIVLRSDIGLLCKSNGEEGCLVYATDLTTARPKAGVRIRAYDRQNQPLAEGTTDAEGRAALTCREEPYLIAAEAGDDRAFLKVERGAALSLSDFDTGGTTSTHGIKGFLFGERGVWRPGDAIYLTFMVASSEPLPENHPATLEFFNPNGQLVQTLVNTDSSDGVYLFRLSTAPSAPTGLWQARVRYGGAVFEKSLRVDAVKPNRMKIEMKLGDGKQIDAADFRGTLTARWLHGAPAAGAKTTLEARLTQTPTRFKGYDDYSFDDETKYFETEERELFSGTTDAEGSLRLTTDRLASLAGLSPGKLSGRFTVKVFEKSGDFSIDQQIVAVSPYKAYFGVAVTPQKSEWDEEYLDSRKEHLIRYVLLDAQGRPVNQAEKVTVSVYRMDSWWWWDASASSSKAGYAKRALQSQYKSVQGTLAGGKGQVAMRWSPGDYGCYLIRVTGERTTHTATRMVYVGSSDFRGDVSSVTDAATRLAITSDREKYAPGDKARITIPSAAGARALVSVESGNVVRESFWIDCAERQTAFDLPIRQGMSPTVYVSATLIQPHGHTLNDAPIRLFGVKRLTVEDASTRLAPEIEMPASVKPESEIEIRVRERDGRKMSYVLALVDDGLLGLTRFRTPDPYAFFNATEALGVRTWDLFDHVIGAYGGRIEQLFAIGGDGEQPNAGALKAQRFKPVVRFIGVERLAAGKTATHRIALPPYFGSVRVMVVASDGRAFGSAEREVAVKKPLLVQATLPRVVSTDEEIELPATVFALENGVGRIDVEVDRHDLFTVEGPQRKAVTLNASGEEMLTFRLRAGSKCGVGKVRVTATAPDDRSVSEIEIDVREPNPSVTRTEDRILQPGETATIAPLQAGGEATTELSSIPSVDLTRRMEYLVRYPHGCIEQIVSGAFPQLYLPAVSACDEPTLGDIDRNIKSVLSRLGQYQLSQGGFSYWSGSTSESEWGTVYAAHFMVEAVKYGYSPDRSTMDRALGRLRGLSAQNPLTEAYALYVLALNRTPDRSGMNRLRERAAQLDDDTRWMLAAAYALDGNRKVAEVLTAKGRTPAPGKVDPYDGTYNSPERRMAVALMTLTILDRREEAFRIALRMSEILRSERWLSTQSTAWMLNTLSGFAATGQRGIDAQAGRERIRSDKSIATFPLARPTEVTNRGDAPLYVVVSQRYTPPKGEELPAAEGIRLSVRYKDMDGKELDPRSIPASTDFYAIVTVTNLSGIERYADLALTHIVPAGWEIASERDLSQVDHQDIRDDRVLSYFDLRPGQSREVAVKLTAAYKGRYYLPAVSCEAMYDHSVRALTKGQWVEVVE